MSGDTPRTEQRVFFGRNAEAHESCVSADFARQLERELTLATAALAEKDRQIRELTEALASARKHIFSIRQSDLVNIGVKWELATKEAMSFVADFDAILAQHAPPPAHGGNEKE